jgi:hypothetical protein
MSGTLIQADYAKYCGKEVRIIEASGKTFAFSEGPLFIWDKCAACGTEVSADISGEGSKSSHRARLDQDQAILDARTDESSARVRRAQRRR